MSELLVNTIKKADGTGSLSVPAESGTVVTTASPSLGRRNLIINGAMQVAQRGTSFANADDIFTLDRWKAFKYVGNAEYTVSQEADSPDGVGKSLKATITSTDTVDASEFYMLRYVVEGYDSEHLAWGTADAKTVTLSFWVKSSLTGTFSGSFRNDGGTGYSTQTFEYTINQANTWEQKTITVTGPTSGNEWLTGNAGGVWLFWSLGLGSNWQANAGSWGTTNAFGTSNQTQLMETNGATFYITNVQLEVGSVATPFEHRSYGEELALCQRYYYRMNGRGSLGIFHKYTGGQGYLMIHLPVTMRSTPSLDSSTGTQYYRVYGSGLNDFFTAWAGTQGVQEGSFDKVMIYGDSTAFNVSSNGTSGWVQLYNTSAYVAFSAEL